MTRARLGHSLSGPQRAALAALVRHAIYELVPVAGMEDAAAALPPRTSVTVTASPRHGIDATVRAAEWLAAQGHDVCPHLAARSIRDRAHLADILARLHAAGIRKAFVVGGDGDAIGEFRDGLTLLRGMEPLGGWLEELGVPAYPEGHPTIPNDVLLDDLRAKQPYAHFMTTQMAFNPDAIAAWIARMRAAGIMLPVHLGVPGVLPLRKLTSMSARIGVAESARYLMKNRALIGYLARGSFGPDALLAGAAPTLADPDAKVSALHIFTMNNVAETAEWQRAMLEELSS